MKRIPFQTVCRGRTIFGTLYAPDTDRFPIVVFCHSLNGRGEDFHLTASYFAEHGIGGLLFDFCGGGTHDKSGFPTTNMTLFTEKEDLNAVIDEWKKCSCSEKIYLFGSSQGGMVAAMTAEERDDISAMTLLFPGFNIAEHWRRQFPSKADIPDSFELFGMTLGKEYFLSIRDFTFFPKYPGPVLLFHGAEDSLVPLRYSQSAAKLYKNASLVVFEGEKHGFSKAANAEACTRSLAFMQSLSCACVRKIF